MALAACRKPAPDEVVYTGARDSASGGRTGTGGSTAAGASGGSTGSAGAMNAGGGGQGGGGQGPAPVSCGAVTLPQGPFDKQQLLVAAAECAQIRYCEFEARAIELRDETKVFATDPSSENAEAAQAAFRAALASWQHAELFRFGPAEKETSPARGGLDLRSQIYAWPLVSRCKIEEQLVSGAYAKDGFAETLISGRTLSAMEYLLFYGGSDNACSEFSAINSAGTWASLSADELSARKAAYSAAAADDVLARAAQLREVWSPSGGNYEQALVTAGAGSPYFADIDDALNAISDALFYVENEVKDIKLGRPLGITDCTSASCAAEVESRYARVSTQNIRANLRGFRLLFQGCGDNYEGVGFDDWLVAAMRADLATDMLAALTAAETAVDELDPPLEEAVVSAKEKATDVHAKVKALTDLLKTDFITVLNLELPTALIGDND